MTNIKRANTDQDDSGIDLNIPNIDLRTPRINLDSLPLHTQMITSSVQGLLSLGIITDPTDLKRVTAAMEYLRNPSGNFDVFSKHIQDIGESLAIAEMDEPLPDSIYAMHAQLIRLEVKHHINAAEAAFGINPSDPELGHLLILARDAAKNLADGYKDRTLLVEVEGLIVQLLGITTEEFLRQYQTKAIR
ncbi:MAG: hypothetical protein PHZ00_05510 [Candidatus Peribacteraceae bacterium]|nr:hypothetical protein [Candidatus Peribacteraceae bacterium]